MASAASGLRHPASASCLGRHARLTGRCPNNSSLFPPLAAVVVVAILEEKLFLMFANRQSLRALPVCFFTGRGRRGKRQLADACFLRKRPRGREATSPSPSAHYVRIHLSQGERPWQRDEACVDCQGLTLWESWQSRQALTERARTVVLRPCLLLYMYKSGRTVHTKHCAAGAAEFSTGRKACGLCILHRKCAL